MLLSKPVCNLPKTTSKLALIIWFETHLNSAQEFVAVSARKSAKITPHEQLSKLGHEEDYVWCNFEGSSSLTNWTNFPELAPKPTHERAD